MTIHPSPYDIIRAIEDQQAVVEASQKATARLVKMLIGMLDASAPDPIMNFSPTSIRRAIETAGSAAQLSGNAAEPSPVAEPVEQDHVDRGASAQPHSAPSEPAIPSKPGDAGTGQGSETGSRKVVVPPGETAGGAVRDGALVSELAPAIAAAEARPPEVVPPQPLADVALKPEKLAAVDVLRCRVFGPGGNVFVNARAARALDVLKHGDLFGLDHVATKAKIPSASDCRHALRIEEASLRSIGLEVWSDKLNARLRAAS